MRLARLSSPLQSRLRSLVLLLCELLSVLLLYSGPASAAFLSRQKPGYDQLLSSLFLALSCLFFVGFLRSFYRAHVARSTLFKTTIAGHLLSPPSFEDLRSLCQSRYRPIVRFAIFIPARGESRVIANTLTHLSTMHYDFRYVSIFVITDSRETSIDGSLLTSDVARHCADGLNAGFGHEVIHVLSVPDSYDGQKLSGKPPSIASSKGRALNYALDVLLSSEHKVDLIGILDADGRLNSHVLIEAAIRFVRDGSAVLQGPVLQISNLDRVDLFGVMAGVELSMHHLSSLATELQSKRRYARFLAGTNYFICPHLLSSVGAWNSLSLVEDAELGLRIFFRTGRWASWLPCPEIEQTSPSLQIYLRQRHRWALGHLQLLPQIHQASLHSIDKLFLFWKVGKAILVAPLTTLLPILGWALAIFYVVPSGPAWSLALSLALTLLSIYTWDDFGRGLRLLNLQSPRPLSACQVLRHSIAFMLMMPCLMVVQLIPRLRALLDFLFSKKVRSNQISWYKTERSVEDVMC